MKYGDLRACAQVHTHTHTHTHTCRYRVRVQAHTQKRGASSWSDEALFRTLPGGDSAEAYWGYIFMVVFSLLLSYVVFVLE